jgi:ArgP family transcriptional regulator
MSTFDPDALECLAAIVEEGGFERAAQRLSITQSAVSQRLRALEAQVGTVLIVRSRPLKATSAGQLLLKHTKMLRLLRADLERDLKELAPSSLRGASEEGRISIAINADSIATWALQALTELAQQGLPLEIITDDQDFTQEWLREGQVLGCVTTLKQALRGCKVVALGAMEYVAVASPTFAQDRLAKPAVAGSAARSKAPSTAVTPVLTIHSLWAQAGHAQAVVCAIVGRPGACRAGGLGRQRGAALARAGPDGPGPARQCCAHLHTAYSVVLALLESGVRSAGRADSGAQAIFGAVIGALK